MKNLSVLILISIIYLIGCTGDTKKNDAKTKQDNCMSYVSKIIYAQNMNNVYGVNSSVNGNTFNQSINNNTLLLAVCLMK